MKFPSLPSLPCFGGLLAAALLSPATAQESAERLLLPNDTVEVKVFQETDLDSKTTISKDGKVALPLIGQVPVAGLTTADAAKVISLRYKDGYLVNPSVTVSVTLYARLRFDVQGAVVKPNSYYFPAETDKLTLIQALGIAGGFSRVAKESEITVKRAGTGKVIKVDGRKLREEGATPFMIFPGDSIHVKESTF